MSKLSLVVLCALAIYTGALIQCALTGKCKPSYNWQKQLLEGTCLTVSCFLVGSEEAAAPSPGYGQHSLLQQASAPIRMAIASTYHVDGCEVEVLSSACDTHPLMEKNKNTTDQ